MDHATKQDIVRAMLALTNGRLVRYSPHTGSSKTYLGYIAGPGRLLGDELVFPLRDMDEAYQKLRPSGRHTVAAAHVGCIEPVHHDAPPAEPTPGKDGG